MTNPRLARRYAKSLADLATERGQLETVYEDMLLLKTVFAASHDFVVLLRSPVVPGSKKQAIIEQIVRGKVTDLTILFTRLLVNKGREGDLPDIVKAYIGIYQSAKGIHKVTLTTAVPVGEEVRKSIESKVGKDCQLQHIELETKVDADLIGGFVLEFNNNQVDASVAKDLRDVKKQFSKNVYVRNIR